MKHDNVDSGIRALRWGLVLCPGFRRSSCWKYFYKRAGKQKKLRKIQVHFKLATTLLKRASMSET